MASEFLLIYFGTRKNVIGSEPPKIFYHMVRIFCDSIFCRHSYYWTWRKVQVVNIMHPFSFSCDKGCGDYYNLVQWLNNLGDKFPKLSMYIKEICALHLWKYVRVSKLTHFYMDVVNSELCISAGASMSCLIMTNKFTD